MAGIGFALRKLAAQDNFSGILRAFVHSAIAAVGPWIMIVVAMTCIYVFAQEVVDASEIQDFEAVLVYNFFFSFILSGGLYSLTARYVSDCLYRRDPLPVPGIFLVSMAFLLIPAVLLSTGFYSFYTEMDRASVFFSIVQFVLLSEIWLAMLYLGCIRNFKAISWSWIAGMVVTVILTVILGQEYGCAGMLAGMSIGLTLLLAVLKGNIFAEYPYAFQKPKDFGFYFRYYKGLFWSGMFLNAGMWIDKIIMWGAKEAVLHHNHLVTYPAYDGGMFLSYLSIIPAAAYFIYSLETNFYESYIQYIESVEKNAPLQVLNDIAEEICEKIRQNGRTLLVIQGSVTLLLILTAPKIFEWANFNFLELSIFRFGLLGAFFTVLNLFVVILFSYFDNDRRMMVITVIMLGANIVFTLIFRGWGVPWYGVGFCLAMIVTFLVGALLFLQFLRRFTYHIFISNVVRRRYTETR
ncbi:MAG: exopolysaccharide Pel transporter PelG [Verrucomicrobiota bacterium]|nr:exopolysaccharide Pel transporter PelG [Verrucomicrobiota bacterium]